MAGSDESSRPSSIAKAAVANGRLAIDAVAAGAKGGARLAVGTLFAGCNVLLDLGVKATRRLSRDGNGSHLDLEAPDVGFAELGHAISEAKKPHDGAVPLGWWIPDDARPETADAAFFDAIGCVEMPVYIVDSEGQSAIITSGRAVLGGDTAATTTILPLRAYCPAILPESLGDPAFRAAHGLRYAYVTGAMANGIGSEEIVEAMSRAGMLGFFGSAGLAPARVEAAIDRIQRSVGNQPYGFNLIHSPNEPHLESTIVELYLRRGVRLVEASAYLDLTPALIRYRLAGIHRDAGGRVVCPNQVIAKVSRVEVARKFFSPAPSGIVDALVRAGHITAQQAEWAKRIPVATDLTVEADSGGHTDNRPALALLPGMTALRDELQTEFNYLEPLRVGAAGGIATPASAAAAFAMGAAYVVTGSINQSCVEAGTSQIVREMLAQAGQADVAMAPAADMFEMGVKVQVLKWGTMFSVRARKLYDLYRAHNNLDELPATQRAMLERDYFRCTIEEAWEQTKSYFEDRDPSQIARAEADAKHKMALVFRSYLGQSSHWANSGDASRKADYQIWCGPAMGAFNEWVRGSFLEKVENRRVVTVAMNLLRGAAVLTRVNFLRVQDAHIPTAALNYRPLPLEACVSHSQKN